MLHTHTRVATALLAFLLMLLSSAALRLLVLDEWKMMFSSTSRNTTAKVSCSECPKSFVHPRNLLQHRKIAHEGVRYKCSDCDSSYTRLYNLKNHRLKAHLQTGAKMFFQQKLKGDRRNGTVIPAFPVSARQQKPKKSQISQAKRQQGLLPTAHFVATPGRPIDVLSGPVKLHACLSCPFQTQDSAGLRAHLRRHGGTATPKNQIKCHFCDYVASDFAGLVNHGTLHFSKQVAFIWNDSRLVKKGHMSCSFCGRKFENSVDLCSHEKLHTLSGVPM